MAGVKLFTARYDECKGELLDFRNQNRAADRDAAYFDWRYMERPLASEPIIVWAESAAGRRIGSLSVLSQHYLFNNTLRPVGILGDISVSQESRGMGIAQEMFDYLSRLKEMRDFEVCIVLPNEDAASPLSKCHWRRVSQVRRYVKKMSFAARLLSAEAYLKGPSAYRGQLVTDFDERFNELWDAVDKGGMIIGLRNQAYLTWRYARHPLVKYQAFTLLDHTRLCGYIVFSQDKDRYQINDILCLNGRDYSVGLLFTFLKFARTNPSIASVTLNINNNHMSQFPLLQLGFIRRLDYLTFMVNDPGDDIGSFLSDGRKWYLTHADKDV